MAFQDMLMRENQQSGQGRTQQHINPNLQQPNNQAMPQTTRPASYNTAPSKNIPQSTF